MPIYQQICKSCGNRFEMIVLSANSDAPRPCPKCESENTQQLISLCSFRMGTEAKFEMKRGKAHNPFQDLTLDNVRDEFGKPVKVNSEAELHSAEKRYNFVHAASWGMQDAPPQHEADAGQIYRKENRKWNKNDAAYGPDKVAEAAKEVGFVKGPEQTLANAPNPV
jgi:putative FmdB family regulatory protein